MARRPTADTPTLRDSIPPPKPVWPDGRAAVAVSFSGGGFRASLAGIGVLRGLADLDLLRDVRYTSSVSGGSWANALLALNWEALKEQGFTADAVDALIIEPFVRTITTRSLLSDMLREGWRLAGADTRSDLLGRVFDTWFGHGAHMGDLSPDARFIFNSTNLDTGTRFFFEQARVGSYQDGYLPGDTVRLADALAASAALPGIMSAQRMRHPNDVYPKDRRPYLVDGAVYDNLGLESFNQIRSRPLLVVLDAGARFKTGVMGRRELVGTLARSSKVYQNQVTTLRRRWLIDDFRTWEDWEENEPEAYAAYTADPLGVDAAGRAYDKRRRAGDLEPDEMPPPVPPRTAKRGVTFGLKTSMAPEPGTKPSIEATISRHQRYQPDGAADEVPPWHAGLEPKAFRQRVADVPMSVGKFDEVLCGDLIYRGWWLTRESLRTFHPDALTVDPPAWREWNGRLPSLVSGGG